MNEQMKAASLLISISLFTILNCREHKFCEDKFRYEDVFNCILIQLCLEM